MKPIQINVLGIPAPQGSKRHVGNGRMIESSKKVKPWRDSVGYATYEAMHGMPPLLGAIMVDITFLLPRPNSVSIKRRLYPSVKPDIDKLLRSTLDGMTNIAYKDDAQVVQVVMSKEYSNDGRSGAVIRVNEV